jgi:FMN phosphatase YigB (HAD superfamily)
MSECLLVDDSPLNVDKAKAAGWHGLLFTDAVSFQHKLLTELTASDGAKA